MHEATRQPKTEPPQTTQSFDWYSEGEGRIVEVNGVRITVRYVGRKGRRARFVIEAPAGAVFMDAFMESTALESLDGNVDR